MNLRLRELYLWIFDYIKEDGRKTIGAQQNLVYFMFNVSVVVPAKDVAEFVWGLTLPLVFPLYDQWTKFLEEKVLTSNQTTLEAVSACDMFYLV